MSLERYLSNKWIKKHASSQQEIANWPSTKDLGMTDRTELITRIITAGESVLDHPQLADPNEH